MNSEQAGELRTAATRTLITWSQSHQQVSLVLGKSYLPALDLRRTAEAGVTPQVIAGDLCKQNKWLYGTLHSMGQRRREAPEAPSNRALYLLPDWDDMLDENFDFELDQFSDACKASRGEKHCIELMRPTRICDGVLVSLAQTSGSKGALKKVAPTDLQSLAPCPLRDRFALQGDQWVFGDCGAFSYVNQTEPTITVEQAASLYELYQFDFGCSVDHIPVKAINAPEGRRELSTEERRARIELTRTNAAEFLQIRKKRNYTFIPVGVIQGLTPEEYARLFVEYVRLGYRHIALGGLVPRSDTDILEIIKAVYKERQALKKSVWLHAFGVFRPDIQESLREHNVNSFDSATYFRKAWLRSTQNYLSTSGQWYAAIRVPMTDDGRTRKRLEDSKLNIDQLKALEREAVKALHEYGRKLRSLDATMTAVEAYDFLLNRGSGHGPNLAPSYRKTLEDRPWESCSCPVCKELGINVVIFRGSNRNKRRGAHNTAMLYGTVMGPNNPEDEAARIR